MTAAAAKWLVIQPGDTRHWRDHLFASAPLRAMAKVSPLLTQDLLPLLARQQVAFYDPAPGHPEELFTVWFAHAVANRHYENDVLQDLYFLHELMHLVSFSPDAPRSIEEFSLLLRANEIAVSLETEFLIYEHCPALRPLSFTQAIWHDQRPLDTVLPAETLALVKADPYEQQLRAAVGPWPFRLPAAWTPERYEALWWARRHATRHPATPAEQTIHHYESAHQRWIERWRSHWEKVVQYRSIFDKCMHHRAPGAAMLLREWIWGGDLQEGVPFSSTVEAL